MLETRPSTVLQIEVEHFELTKVDLLFSRHFHRCLIQHFLFALSLLRYKLEPIGCTLPDLRVVLLLSICGLLAVGAGVVRETANAALLHTLLRLAGRREVRHLNLLQLTIATSRLFFVQGRVFVRSQFLHRARACKGDAGRRR